MRWIAFFIFGYCVVALQMGLGGHFIIWGAQPNLVLIAAVFIALRAPREAALIGCLLLGLMQDIATFDRFGLYALSYGIFALVAGGYSSGSNAVRGNPLAHFLLTLLGGIILAIVLVIQSWLPFTHEIHRSLASALWGGVYSALLAPLSIALLNRLSGIFQFQSARGSWRS